MAMMAGASPSWLGLSSRAKFILVPPSISTLRLLPEDYHNRVGRGSMRITSSGCIVSASSAEYKEFVEASKSGNLVPIFQRIFGDHLTPVLAYRCLVKEDDREAPSFLFESVEHGNDGSNVGRYSMVGAQPAMEIVAKEDFITILNHEEGSRVEKVTDDPMKAPMDIASNWKPVLIEGLPDVFCGGWVGYLSYDTIRYVEKKKLPFERAPDDDRGLPDIHLGLYKDVVVFDHVSKIIYIIHWVHLEKYTSIAEAYDGGKNKLEQLVSRIQCTKVPKLSSGSVDLSLGKYGLTTRQSNMTKEEYMKAISKAKEHILAGDIFQVVLSQRFERRTFADPFEVYRALRIVNPSPYMIYLQARGAILVASSPEILTRIKERKVINRPLAGTRRRGITLDEDNLLERELLMDQKECAEHVMLVDLGRNDVGKVSKAGTVTVDKFMEVERYSHVMHISSTVSGELLDELTGWDALRAALPVGTVSGAPKVTKADLLYLFRSLSWSFQWFQICWVLSNLIACHTFVTDVLIMWLTIVADNIDMPSCEFVNLFMPILDCVTTAVLENVFVEVSPTEERIHGNVMKKHFRSTWKKFISWRNFFAHNGRPVVCLKAK